MEKMNNKKKTQMKQKPKASVSKYTIKFKKKNYLTFLGGLLTLLLGYILLAKGSIVLAPVLLILGYLVIIPVSIFVR